MLKLTPPIVKREKRLKILFVALLIGNLNHAFSQSIEKIRKELLQAGFENLRILRTEGKLILSIENKTYRWQVLEIAETLDIITENIPEPLELEIFFLKEEIPVYQIQLKADDWKNFRIGNLSQEKMLSGISITSNISSSWDEIKDLNRDNRSFGKIDLILHPQFSFKNTLLKKLYEVQFNVAPAVEVTISNGLKFTGQVIFPIINELGYEGGFIRPGYLTLSQDFRLPARWFGKVTGGNFSDTRYGFDFFMRHPFQNENWNIEINTGLTGSSHFFDYKWTKSKMNTFTWSSSISWFYSHYNLKFKAGAARYVYNDYGLFGSCTRYFGETAFGFYAMIGENNTNGGFHVTIPFPVKKRKNRKSVNVTIPKYYQMTYDAGTEFNYGQSYGTAPEQNRISDNYFPDYIKNELLNLKNN